MHPERSLSMEFKSRAFLGFWVASKTLLLLIMSVITWEFSENKFPTLWTIEFQRHLEKKHVESVGDFIIIIFFIGGFVQNCSFVSPLSAAGNLQSEELHQESSFMFLALKAHNRIFLGSTQQLMK
jgi:hypothetical protein